MKKHVMCAAFTAFLLTVASYSQISVVVYDPTVEAGKAAIARGDRELFDRAVLPKVRKHLASDVCEESVDIAGFANGSFTKAGSQQTLIFYQFCQTGNGLGSVGVAVLENGKIAANYISADSGWTVGARGLPDINQNGLDEFALLYSGGLHQGAGGIGVDIMEFTASGLKGIGWLQAESFADDAETIGYRVTAQKGKVPVWKRVKFIAAGEGKWRRSGGAVPLKLGAPYGKFTVVK